MAFHLVILLQKTREKRIIQIDQCVDLNDVKQIETWKLYKFALSKNKKNVKSGYILNFFGK